MGHNIDRCINLNNKIRLYSGIRTLTSTTGTIITELSERQIEAFNKYLI